MNTHYLIRLVEEGGDVEEELQDIVGLVDEVIICHSRSHQGLARYIDPYGKTSFNGIQCAALIDELSSIAHSDLTDKRRLHLDQLINILRRASTEVHLHVLFLGD